MSSAETVERGRELTAAERWVREFMEGWRAPAGPDQFVEHFRPILAPDVRMAQPQMPTTVGLEAFREGFARPIFTLIPDLHGTVRNWASAGDAIFIELDLEGTLGGKPLKWRTVDRVTLRDGVAVERVADFDPLPLLLAVATRPRSWPRFVRYQLALLRHRQRTRKERR